MSLKVLQISGALSSSEVAEFNNVRASGLGYMVFDIATQMAQLDDLDVDAINFRECYESVTVNKCHFIKMSYLRALFHFRFQNSGLVWKYIFKYWKSRSFLKNLIYAYFVSGYIFDIIKHNSYDIVHFHGCTVMTSLVRRYCIMKNIPFCITMHGLNSFGGVKLDLHYQQFEKDMLSDWFKKNQDVSFVSTGSKYKILQHLKVSNEKNFCTIPNFTDISNIGLDTSVDIRKKYCIPDDGFIILYIGNICWRKNQLTFVNAISALDDDSAKDVYVLFLGRDGKGEESIKSVIEDSKYSSHIQMCGIVPKNQIPSYLSQSNATALISYSEGFGLGIIEGFRFGLPSLAINDMEGIPDFYTSEAMILIEDREIKTVCNGIKQLLARRWDKQRIIEHSMRFTGPEIAKKYKDFYRLTVSHNGKTYL